MIETSSSSTSKRRVPVRIALYDQAVDGSECLDLATIFIGNLSPEVTDSDLREVISEYGEIRSLRLVSRRGLAFIELKPEAAEAAVEGLRGRELKGRTLDVAMDTSGGRPKGRRGRGGFRRRR